MLDLTGQTFGRLTVLSEFFVGVRRDRTWDCRCSCGSMCSVKQAQLRRGKTKSCGCLARELLVARNYRHGMSKTRTWNIWQGMISRCIHSSHTSYPRYCALGVTVCERWSGSFPNFLSDMGEAPDGLSIERKHGALVYNSENCVWATDREQALSRKTTRWVTHAGETLCLKDWAKKIEMPYLKLYKRFVMRGWSFERSIAV